MVGCIVFHHLNNLGDVYKILASVTLMIWLRSMTVFVSLKNSILALPLVRVYRVACYCGSK